MHGRHWWPKVRIAEIAEGCERIIVIDGCPVNCAKVIREQAVLMLIATSF
nr:putative zinc-binding protein [Methanolobus halotolerans]